MAPPYVERLWVYLKELSAEQEILTENRAGRKDRTYSPASDPAEACAKDAQQIQKDSNTITFQFRGLTLMSKNFFAQKIIIPQNHFQGTRGNFYQRCHAINIWPNSRTRQITPLLKPFPYINKPRKQPGLSSKGPNPVNDPYNNIIWHNSLQTWAE